MAFDKEKTLAAAQKFQDREQYEKAIREYNKVLEVEPNDDRIMLSLARCYEDAGKLADAGQMYGKVVQVYRDTGAYQKAIAISKQALKCLPDDEEITLGMAELNNAIGLPHEAVNLLENCLNRHNRETDGEGYLRILTMMVRVDSENVQTRLRYAETLNYLGDKESAKRQYTLVLALLLGKERYVDYIQTAREYLKLEPHDEEVLCELGQIYIKMERYNDALMIMSDLDPAKRSAEMRELFITCYKRLGRRNDALYELKALARQLEVEGGREDRIENVWRQVQQISPNDPDAAAAFGDVPLLSDSALNMVVSPAVENERRNGVSPEVSQAERELAQKFMMALEAYRLGNVEEAKYLCQQILCVNLNYVSALQLLSQIFENEQERPLQAQVERQLAKVSVGTDFNEAVRHVLKAEKCMPGAVENYNLLVSFGVDPSQYGLGNSNGASVPPSLSGHQNPPPVPPRGVSGGSRPPLPPQINNASSGSGRVPEPIQSITPDLINDLNRIDRPQSYASPYQVAKPSVPVSSNSMEFDIDDEELSAAVDEELDDAFDIMFGGPKTGSNSSQMNMYKLQIDDEPPMDEDDSDDSSRTIAHDMSSLTAIAQAQGYGSGNVQAEQSQNPFGGRSNVQSQFPQQPSSSSINSAQRAEQSQNPFGGRSNVQSQFPQQPSSSSINSAQRAEQSQNPFGGRSNVQSAFSQPTPPPVMNSGLNQAEQPQNPFGGRSNVQSAFSQPTPPPIANSGHYSPGNIQTEPPQNPFGGRSNVQSAFSQPTPPPVVNSGNNHIGIHSANPFPPPVQSSSDGVNSQSNTSYTSNQSSVSRITPGVSGVRHSAASRKYPVSGMVPAAPSASSSSLSAAGRSAVPGISASRPLGVVPARIPNAERSPSPVIANSMPASATPVSQGAVPSAGLSAGNSGVVNQDLATALSGIPGISMPSSASPVPYVEPARTAGIPDSERQKVIEALQEVEFYASLMLDSDARALLQGLIDKYGDIDIIHEAKVKLDAG